MSPNKEVVTKYFECLSRLDRQALGSCLTDNVVRVEWADGSDTSGVPIRGRPAVLQSIGNPPGSGGLRIQITRMTEEGNVVVAESIVRVPTKDGSFLVLRALNVFELENGKVSRVDAFTAIINDATQGGDHRPEGVSQRPHTFESVWASCVRKEGRPSDIPSSSPPPYASESAPALRPLYRSYDLNIGQ